MPGLSGSSGMLKMGCPGSRAQVAITEMLSAAVKLRHPFCTTSLSAPRSPGQPSITSIYLSWPTLSNRAQAEGTDKADLVSGHSEAKAGEQRGKIQQALGQVGQTSAELGCGPPSEVCRLPSSASAPAQHSEDTGQSVPSAALPTQAPLTPTVTLEGRG